MRVNAIGSAGAPGVSPPGTARDGFAEFLRENIAHLAKLQSKGEVATGLLYIEETGEEMHEMNGTPGGALVDIPYAELCPGDAALSELMDEFR